MRRHAPVPWRPLFLDTVDSTNDEAKRMARAGAPSGAVVWAGSQTAGRGRRGRAWASPPGNLYMSIVLRPEGGPAAAAQLGFVAALALVAAVAPLLPAAAAVRVKWPNDILVNDRKVAGELMETEAAGRGLEWLVLGVGVNVASFPPDAAFAATSLRAEGAGAVTPSVVLDGFLAEFRAGEERWRRLGFAPVREDWIALAAGLDGRIEARLPTETVSGTYVGLDEEGALLLALPDGGRRRIGAADVFFTAG